LTQQTSAVSQIHGFQSLNPLRTSLSCSHRSRAARNASCFAAASLRFSDPLRSRRRAGSQMSCGTPTQKYETWVLCPDGWASLMGTRAPERSEATALGMGPFALKPSVKLHTAGDRSNVEWCKGCELLRCSLGGTGTAHRVDRGILALEQCAVCIKVI
jgi:hypothetical protein